MFLASRAPRAPVYTAQSVPRGEPQQGVLAASCPLSPVRQTILEVQGSVFYGTQEVKTNFFLQVRSLMGQM